MLVSCLADFSTMKKETCFFEKSVNFQLTTGAIIPLLQSYRMFFLRILLISFTLMFYSWARPQFRWLVASFPSRRPSFDLTSRNVVFVMDKMVPTRVSTKYFGFSAIYHPTHCCTFITHPISDVVSIHTTSINKKLFSLMKICYF